MYDTVSNSGDNESMMRVEVRGVLVSFIELEREYEESFNVEWEQRANLSRDVGEVETSQVFLEDETS